MLQVKCLSFKPILQSLKQSKERTAWLYNEAVVMLSQRLAGQVRRGVPRGEDFANLRDSISVLQSSEVSCGVYAQSKTTCSAKVAKLDNNKVVVYVHPPKGKIRKVPDVTRVLIQHNPWTLDTIPVWPAKREAQMVYRKVSERECLGVRKDRTKEATKWRHEFAQYHVVLPAPKDTKFPPKATAVEDVAFIGRRLEYGYGKMSAKPLWRTGIHDLSSGGGRGKIQQLVTRALSPKFHGWTKRATTDGAIAPSDVHKYRV